ncbi:hypothetical protein ACVW00_003859 [Marmoricola sp. URHA0025 HA25]
MTGTEDDRRARQQQVYAVVVKIVGVAVAVGLVIGIGAWLMVKALGLDSADSTSLGVAQVDPVTPLPSSALPVPTGSDLPTPDNTGLVSPGATVSGDLFLSASPVLVSPSERINLTGRWAGHDNESLLVQRFENGQWADFGVQVRVNLGTFETYVLTSRTGDQRFRVFEPDSQTASNEVTVTVG